MTFDHLPLSSRPLRVGLIAAVSLASALGVKDSMASRGQEGRPIPLSVDQRISALLNVPRAALSAELCLQEECETIPLGASAGGQLEVLLTYSAIHSTHLPDVTIEGGLPSACQRKARSPSTDRVIGVSLDLAEGTSRSREKLALRAGGQTLLELPRTASSGHRTTSPLLATLCVAAI